MKKTIFITLITAFVGLSLSAQAPMERLTQAPPRPTMVSVATAPSTPTQRFVTKEPILDSEVSSSALSQPIRIEKRSDEYRRPHRKRHRKHHRRHHHGHHGKRFPKEDPQHGKHMHSLKGVTATRPKTI
ncbi:hypothetical protein H0W26_03710 [Candidatus Dependentiae bacterium]|nr:hypothetical protein [Candidatus Dependentiae bacterium]